MVARWLVVAVAAVGAAPILMASTEDAAALVDHLEYTVSVAGLAEQPSLRHA